MLFIYGCDQMCSKSYCTWLFSSINGNFHSINIWNICFNEILKVLNSYKHHTLHFGEAHRTMRLTQNFGLKTQNFILHKGKYTHHQRAMQMDELSIHTEILFISVMNSWFFFRFSSIVFENMLPILSADLCIHI